jgi:UDP-N-acetylglucosamine 1-carboxyvinyltransferase
MSDLIVNGGQPLAGTITPSGNKNSVLPILCASLLTDDPVELRNVPAITDVEKLVVFFQEQGSRIVWDKPAARWRSTTRPSTSAPAARRGAGGHAFGRAAVRAAAAADAALTLPANAKGCSLGIRELDPHLEILELPRREDRSGRRADIALPRRFKRARHWPDYMSVTATENFVMAAALAEGESTLLNAASEPHVQDLCPCSSAWARGSPASARASSTSAASIACKGARSRSTPITTRW